MRLFAPLRRPSALWLAAVSLSSLAVATTTFAADAKPAKKDSRAAVRPKEATFTTSVEPATVRPGEVVTFKVTANIDAPWHIYRYSKKPADDGPKYTEFDFFDTAGLKPVGDWTASTEPIKKKEPAFPDIPFLEFHEDEVTWSIKLKVPANQPAGKKELRCQIGYMICSDQNCSFPGQWTLPAAELTILPSGSGLFPAMETVLVAIQAPAPEGPKPVLKDRGRKPKDIELKAEIVPASAKVGEKVELKVTATVKPPWHIYKYLKDDPGTGPTFTAFDLFDPAGLAPAGEWTPSRAPIKKKDTAFKDLPFLEYYEGEVSWSLPLEVGSGVEPGSKQARVQMTFMICTESNCSPQIRMTLPPVAFTVEPGVAAKAAAVPAIPPEVKPVAPAEKVGAPSEKSEVEAAPASDSVDAKMKAGILPFLLFCATGGLFALAMPCVWPMIPVTVNFFVKQGQRTGSSPTGLAFVYGLSIVGIFMAVGLLFSVSFGAASLSKLANNPWLNFGVAALFLVFGLSLLGLFEIRLPNFLLNASAKGEGRGGLIGVMFMALTLTITSFTCTFPVVGGLLVLAANGSYLYPVIGLATFASVLAFPFLMLALSPGLLAKMPKSGDWMNTVKVVGGLIEIGAAFKFINTAECIFVVPREAWFNAYAVLTIWVVLALICGIYLLGLFRTDHDLEEVKVGPGRIIGGWAFLSLALFLAPALFGMTPRSKLWYLVVGLLPADAGDLRVVSSGGGGKESLETKATSTDPKLAERQQTTFHGVRWGMSYEGALERAKLENKPVLIDFTGVNCANCRLMEQEVLPRGEVVAELEKFVTVQLYTDTVPIDSLASDKRLELADANIKREEEFFEEVTNPNYVALDSNGKILAKLGGKVPPERFVKFLEDALTRFGSAGKVAQSN